MNTQSIQLNVTLNNKNIPEHIDWAVSTDPNETPQPAKAFVLSLWDGEKRTALRMDLWTNRMMMDEMNEFITQTLITLGESYTRASRDEELGKEFLKFANQFKEKANQKLQDSDDAPDLTETDDSTEH